MTTSLPVETSAASVPGAPNEDSASGAEGPEEQPTFDLEALAGFFYFLVSSKGQCNNERSL